MIYCCRIMGWISITEADSLEEAVADFKSMAASASILPRDIDDLLNIDMGDGDGIAEATLADIAEYRAMTAPITPKKLNREQEINRLLLGASIKAFDVGDHEITIHTTKGDLLVMLTNEEELYYEVDGREVPK